MDKKLSDINEMIDQNQEDDDDVKNNHCTSNRSTPTNDDRDKEKTNDNDDALESPHDADHESRDNGGDRCSSNSSNVNKPTNTISTRTMSEELALKDKEVSCNKRKSEAFGD